MGALLQVQASDSKLQKALEVFELKDLAISLIALSSFAFVTATEVVGTLADIARFGSAKELMAYVETCTHKIPKWNFRERRLYIKKREQSCSASPYRSLLGL